MKKYTITLVVIFIYFLNANPLFSAELSWDKNNDAAYYKICWRTDYDTEYINCSDEIDAQTTSFNLFDSPYDDSYHYAIQAYNACGNSSDFSGEVTMKGVPEDLARTLNVKTVGDGNKSFKLIVNNKTIDDFGLINTYFIDGTDISIIAFKDGVEVSALSTDFTMDRDVSLTLNFETGELIDNGNTGGTNPDISTDGQIGSTGLNSSGIGAAGGGCFISSLIE